MSKQRHSESSAYLEIRAKAIVDLHRQFIANVRAAVERFLHPRPCERRMSTVSLAHDAKCFKEYGEAICVHLATMPFRSDGDFAKWLLELWLGLQADQVHLNQRLVVEKDRARIFRGLDLIYEIWAMMYRFRYASVAQGIVASLQLVVDHMSTPVDALVTGASTRERTDLN